MRLLISRIPDAYSWKYYTLRSYTVFPLKQSKIAIEIFKPQTNIWDSLRSRPILLNVSKRCGSYVWRSPRIVCLFYRPKSKAAVITLIQTDRYVERSIRVILRASDKNLETLLDNNDNNNNSKDENNFGRHSSFRKFNTFGTTKTK